MSSTNNSLSEGEFFAGMSVAFFRWLNNDFLPTALIVLYSFFIVAGIAINVIMLVVAGMGRLYKESVHAFLIQLCLVDLLASFFVLIPTLKSVASEESAFGNSGAGCNFQGVMFMYCLQLSFSFLTLAIFERAFKLLQNQRHLKVFGNTSVIRLLITCVWVGNIFVALLTLTGDVKYDKDQFLCVLKFTTSPVFMHVLFALIFYLPCIFYIVCFIAVYVYKAKRIHTYIDNHQAHSVHSSTSRPPSAADSATLHPQSKKGSTSVFILEIPRNMNRSNARVGDVNSTESTQTDFKNLSKILPSSATTRSKRTTVADKFDAKSKWKAAMKSVTTVNKIRLIFGDKPEDADHHQSVTYLITWITTTLCWLMYIVSGFTEVYSVRCPACYRVGILVGLASFWAKPLIYIGHNRWYRAHCWNQLRRFVCCRRSAGFQLNQS